MGFVESLLATMVRLLLPSLTSLESLQVKDENMKNLG